MRAVQIRVCEALTEIHGGRWELHDTTSTSPVVTRYRLCYKPSPRTLEWTCHEFDVPLFAKTFEALKRAARNCASTLLLEIDSDEMQTRLRDPPTGETIAPPATDDPE